MQVSRYFRFRLRTLLVLVFVVSLPLAWVGYCLNWIRARHAVSHGGNGEIRGPIHVDAPLALQPFGEKGVATIWRYPPLTVDQLQRLFPEAIILESSNDGSTRSYDAIDPSLTTYTLRVRGASAGIIK